jgi:hypothetical protein
VASHTSGRVNLAISVPPFRDLLPAKADSGIFRTFSVFEGLSQMDCFSPYDVLEYPRWLRFLQVVN